MRHDQKREIPWRDNAHHPNWLTHDHPQGGFAQRVVALAVQGSRKCRRIAPDVSGRLNFAARLRDWLADLQAIQQRDFLAAGVDQVSHFQQDGGAVCALHAGPDARIESLPRGRNCGFTFKQSRLLAARYQHIMRRAVPRQHPAIAVFHECAIDEQVKVPPRLAQGVAEAMAVGVERGVHRRLMNS